MEITVPVRVVKANLTQYSRFQAAPQGDTEKNFGIWNLELDLNSRRVDLWNRE